MERTRQRESDSANLQQRLIRFSLKTMVEIKDRNALSVSLGTFDQSVPDGVVIDPCAELVPCAVGIWQNDADRPGGHQRAEVVERIAGIERIDAYPHIAIGILGKKSGHILARGGPGIRGDRILEVQDQCVGAGLARLRQLPVAVGRDEKKTSTHAGFRNINAVRLHSPTSSSC